MCNLYSTTTNQDVTGVCSALAPVVRNAGEDRELIKMRWGMPPPPKFGGAPVTDIHNVGAAKAIAGQCIADCHAWCPEGR
jgi:putative SOS response-associated peptidase YedK